MKYQIPNNVRMVGVSLLVLVAIYGILSVLVKTQEGLSDGAKNANASVIKTTTTNATNATSVLAKLPASTNAYVDLVNSYKNLKMANGILNVSTADAPTLPISDCDHVVDYLNELSGISIESPDAATSLDVPTTPNISLIKK
jgi:hypothetical protein